MFPWLVTGGSAQSWQVPRESQTKNLRQRRNRVAFTDAPNRPTRSLILRIRTLLGAYERHARTSTFSIWWVIGIYEAGALPSHSHICNKDLYVIGPIDSHVHHIIKSKQCQINPDLTTMYCISIRLQGQNGVG